MMRLIKREPVLTAAALLAALSCLLAPPDRAYLGYPDYHVLGLLFSLMIAVAGLRECGLLALLSQRLLLRVGESRRLCRTLVLLCFFSSLLLTNDVALITFVPLGILTLSASGHSALLIPLIVLQTVAANLGSMLTPLGNPQNLFLYQQFALSLPEFFLAMAPAWLLSLALVLLAVRLVIPSLPLEAAQYERRPLDKGALAVFSALLFLCLLAVGRWLPWPVAALAALLAGLYRRRVFRQVDGTLLLTFLFFFVLIGNLQRLEPVQRLLRRVMDGRELFCGAALSQLISNVPAAVLLSGFTRQARALLLGVNLGGLGTPIASMASLISYRLYAALPGARRGRYLGYFTAVNALFLALLYPLCRLLV